MSKHNNVNPDHYKVAGRERTGNTGSAAVKNAQQLHAVNRNVERAPDRDRKKKLRTR
jgi:hypothetical protein